MNPFSLVGKSFKRIIIVGVGKGDRGAQSLSLFCTNIYLSVFVLTSLFPGLVSAPVFFAWNSDTDWGWGSSISPGGELRALTNLP